MKTPIKNLSLLPLLLAAFVLMLAGRVTAQTFTVLHGFTATPAPSFTNSDGVGPNELVLSSNILYGTALLGGSSANGTVFAVNTDGTGFTNLHSFTATDANGNNRDGADPYAGLVLSGNTLYGTAREGGNSGDGTVFAVNTKTIAFKSLYTFTATDPNGNNTDGANPRADLVFSGNTLYGTADGGGIWGEGTVFAVNTTGTGFTPLHSFTATDANGNNNDGANPDATLILSSNTLYGTTVSGGNSGNGTVFAIDTETMAFKPLYSFTAMDANGNNNDGALPNGLILSTGTLYGTSSLGGSSGNGTVFALNTSGTGFTNLYNFSAVRTNAFGIYTNSDGDNPQDGLILSGNTLFGTTLYGGWWGNGTVFRVNTDGTSFTNLYSFTANPGPNYTNTDGANPIAGLILSGTTLYGTTSGGGGSGGGTLFSLSLESVSLPPPLLTLTPSAANVVLTWPTNYAGFDYSGYTLQSTTNLVSPNWTTYFPPPVAVNGQNTVINPISGTQQFFRLSQ